MSAARQLGTSVLACLAGAGLALWTITRVWSVRVTERPGLPALRDTTTGAAEQPWVVGLALVALAGAGALLATRGLPRRAVGVLLVLIGLAIAAGMVAARVNLAAGSIAWPVAGVLSGAIIGAGGLIAARSGHRWPVMGARYERTPGPSAAEPADTRATWDALDRGVDPTDR
jgi:Tryptophan-associated transmembrane protein (Trp_oprn_chp)